MIDPSSAHAPGWAAIDEALEHAYPGVEPRHYAPRLPAMLGGDDPLDGVSAFEAKGPPAHWHLVTYGLSELYEKESDDGQTSGFGFELTFRLARAPGEIEPPPWAYNMLQNLARYVFSTGNAFDVGHQFPFNGPIALGHKTDITAALFARDPELGAIDTPFGRLVFLQVVGITADESRAVRAWSPQGLLALLAEASPLWVTSLERRSLLASPEAAAKVAERTAAEGSSSGATFASQLSFTPQEQGVKLTLAARAVESVRDLLGGRIPFGRDFKILGGGVQVLFRPGARPEAEAEGKRLRVDLTTEAAIEIRQRLEPRRGLYTFSKTPSLSIEVIPTDIKDASGRVVDTIGLALLVEVPESSGEDLTPWPPPHRWGGGIVPSIRGLWG